MSEQTLHIHLDLVGGIAGDMFAAAALDAGLVEREDLQAALRDAGLGPVEVHVERVIRGAIEGTHLSFSGWDPSLDSDHRHLSTIRKMVSTSDLDDGVKQTALDYFEILGRAEAAVHGIPLERVHFHEVGAVDSILDFVAAAWIVEQVPGATWSFSKIPVGSGTIETAHGSIPLPAPATSRVLEGFEVVDRGVETEFVTPTGATILRGISPYQGPRKGRLDASGFGCGTRDIPGISNVLRMTVLRNEATGQAPFEQDQVVQLVTEIDDQSPEQLAYAADRLLDAGALDVVRQSVQMKKGRLGTQLSVLCDPNQAEDLARLIFEETTTIGIRRVVVDRWILRREQRTVVTEYGVVPMKVASWGTDEITWSPEFEACAALAQQAGVTLREVYEAAKQAIQKN